MVVADEVKRVGYEVMDVLSKEYAFGVDGCLCVEEGLEDKRFSLIGQLPEDWIEAMA